MSTSSCSCLPGSSSSKRAKIQVYGATPMTKREYDVQSKLHLFQTRIPPVMNQKVSEEMVLKWWLELVLRMETEEKDQRWIPELVKNTKSVAGVKNFTVYMTNAEVDMLSILLSGSRDGLNMNALLIAPFFRAPETTDSGEGKVGPGIPRRVKLRFLCKVIKATERWGVRPTADWLPAFFEDHPGFFRSIDEVELVLGCLDTCNTNDGTARMKLFDLAGPLPGSGPGGTENGTGGGSTNTGLTPHGVGSLNLSGGTGTAMQSRGSVGSTINYNVGRLPRRNSAYYVGENDMRDGVDPESMDLSVERILPFLGSRWLGGTKFSAKVLGGTP